MMEEKSLESSISKRYFTKSAAGLEAQMNWIGMVVWNFRIWELRDVGCTKEAGGSGGVTSVDLLTTTVLPSVLPDASRARIANLYKTSGVKTGVGYWVAVAGSRGHW